MRQVLASAEWLKKASSASLRGWRRPSSGARPTALATPGKPSLPGLPSSVNRRLLAGCRASCTASAAKSSRSIRARAGALPAQAPQSPPASFAGSLAASITASSKSRETPSATSASWPPPPSTLQKSLVPTVGPALQIRRGARPADRRLPRLLRRIQSIRVSPPHAKCSASKRQPTGLRSKLATRSCFAATTPIATQPTKLRPSRSLKTYAPLSIS